MKMLAVNLAARLTPQRFRAEAGRRFVTPRVRRQSDTGRDFLQQLERADFDGPLGASAPGRAGRGRWFSSSMAGRQTAPIWPHWPKR